MEYTIRGDIIMEKTRKFIGFKDIILVTLLTAICIIINTIVVLPFMANLLLVLLVVPLIEMILCGPIYMLAIAKAPRIGTHFLFTFLFAVYYFFTNGMILISLMILALGIVGELVLLGNGYRNTLKTIIAYATFGLSVVLAPAILTLMNKSSLEKTMLSAGMSQEYVNAMFGVYSPFNIILGAILSVLGAIIGCLIGRRLLKKHFRPAGIVEE